MAEPTIRVCIQCEERVRYSRELEIPVAEFEAWEQAVEDCEDDGWFARFAERYIDRLSHVYDSDEFEDVELTPLPEKVS